MEMFQMELLSATKFLCCLKEVLATSNNALLPPNHLVNGYILHRNEKKRTENLSSST